MYQPLSGLDAPLPEAKIWRYLTFAKFVDLLETGALYFCRSDRLDDPLEGSYREEDVESRRLQLASRLTAPSVERVDKRMSDTNRKMRQYIFACCWIVSEHESDAMWKLYSKGEGVAVRTTYDKLCRSFEEAKVDVHIGKVKYGTEEIDTENVFGPFLRKEAAYVHEQEVRALLLEFKDGPGKGITETEPVDLGVKVPANLKVLIDEIVIDPTAQVWIRDLTNSLVRRYELPAQARLSELARSPLF